MVSELYEHPALYDALFSAGAHLPFYGDLARRQAGAVLELACGTGQLAVPIACTGAPTMGLDVSAAMLDTARQRAAGAKAPVEFVHSDMRHFDFGRRFALIFVARNSLLHLSSPEDFLAVFAAVKRHLTPGGIFAFDVFNPDVRILVTPAGQRVPVMHVATEAFGELSVETTHNYDAATQVNHGTWYVSTPQQRDAWVLRLPIRSIFPQELALLLAAGGFRPFTRFGDLTEEPFSSASPRQVCVCQPDPCWPT